MKLTAPILRDLAHQVTLGNPLLGLAIANEYVPPSDPLHRAFVTHVRRRLERGNGVSRELIDRLSQGQRLIELPEHLKAQVGKRTLFPSRKVLPCPLNFRQRTQRRALRTRAPTHGRPERIGLLR